MKCACCGKPISKKQNHSYFRPPGKHRKHYACGPCNDSGKFDVFIDKKMQQFARLLKKGT
jgi:hypothetical protein